MGELRDGKGRFLKGRCANDEPIEYKIKKMYSLEETWKKSDNYIADLIKDAPYIYNSWRGMRFADKGRSIRNSKEWDKFKTFYNDVRPSYKPGLIFRRLDATKPFSKENFIWVTQGEAVLLKSNLIWIEYDGKKLTLQQWSREANTSFMALKQRYYNSKKHNYTVQEIIYGRLVRRGSKKPKDHTQSNIRAKASKMISSYKANDYKKHTDICDMDIDWLIENILKKPCHYCGDNWRIGCDRIDNNKGHIKSNVVPCCIECNSVRNNLFSVEEMMILGKVIKSIKDARNKTDRPTPEIRDRVTAGDLQYN